MEPGVLQDMAGNEYNGLSGLEYYFEMLDTSAPVASVQIPASGSEANKSTAIVLTFSEGIQVCAGFLMCSAL